MGPPGPEKMSLGAHSQTAPPDVPWLATGNRQGRQGGTHVRSASRAVRPDPHRGHAVRRRSSRADARRGRADDGGVAVIMVGLTALALALVGAGVWTNVAQGIAKAVGDLITKTVGHAV